MDRLGPGFAALLLGGLLLFWGGILAVATMAASLPGDAGGRLAAFFSPATTADEALGAVVAAGGQPLDSLFGGRIWIVSGDEAGFVGRLKSRGMMFALRDLPAAPGLTGCVYAVAQPFEERFRPVAGR